MLTAPEKPMARRRQKQVLDRHLVAKLLHAPAEDPLSDNSFDAAVSTLVLCTVERTAHRALRGLWRVRRPGGRLLFMEHVRSGDQKLARLQDRMMPTISAGRAGTASAPDSIRSAGFAITELGHDMLKHATVRASA
jgi:ubiquinone/menaquinone biosynthesis C-methylase UbiE